MMGSVKKKDWPYELALGGLILAGSLLWGINWWSARPLFIDEANLARNLYDRSFTGLWQPLDFQQYAPPLYLVLTKACGELLGYGERALRLPALLAAFLTLGCLIRIGRQLDLGRWVLLPLALLFVNPEVLRYVGELKPYSLDLAVAALLLLLGLSWPRADWRWALVGSLVVWLSLPAVFLLAILPLPRLWRADRKTWLRWGGVISCWLVSFGVLYWLVLAPSVGKSLLTTFHAPYFFPLPGRSYFSWEQVLRLLLAQPRLAFGFTAVAIGWGLLMTLAGGWATKGKTVVLLILPTLLVFAVSSLEKYSLIPRLMLFTLPGWWLLATLGTRALWQRCRHQAVCAFLLLLGWGIVLPGTNVLRHYTQPLQFSDARSLTINRADDYTPVVHKSAVPGYDYYRRIHPASATDTGIVAASTLQEQALHGNYVVLYDVLTKAENREQVRQDSSWAVEHGATEVRVEPLYRSARLYVRFPEAD